MDRNETIPLDTPDLIIYYNDDEIPVGIERVADPENELLLARPSLDVADVMSTDTVCPGTGERAVVLSKNIIDWIDASAFNTN